jgi:NAD(P)-dependent dehydrogenase (short-subunit alcohol dehydrogenase family)
MNRSNNESIGCTMNAIALVTGATQGLGLGLVQGLARQLHHGEVVYPQVATPSASGREDRCLP